jgi:hypothetical protein
MGVVYLVHDPRLDRPVAFKLIRSRGANPVALERFWREAQSLAKVRHQGVIRDAFIERTIDSVFRVRGARTQEWLEVGPRTWELAADPEQGSPAAAIPASMRFALRPTHRFARSGEVRYGEGRLARGRLTQELIGEIREGRLRPHYADVEGYACRMEWGVELLE